MFGKRGFEVSTYITFLYVITSFCSVKLFDMNLVETAYRNPSFFATIVYCVLLTIPIIAIYRLKLNNLNYEPNKRCINIIGIFYFILLFVFVILYRKAIIFVLTFEDMAVLRNEAVNGDIGVTSYGGLLKYLSMVVSIMATASYLMILLFFISVIYLKNKWYINLMILAGSLTSVLQGFLDVSRSSIIYFVIFLGLSLSLFWKKLSTKHKTYITPVLIALLLGMGTYFMAVTNDRFSENNDYGGTSGGLISYAGMPYKNFCYFFDNYHNPTGISTRFLLPATNYIFNDFKGGTQREVEMEKITNFNTYAFMTYLGSFIMDCNQFAPFIYILIYLYLLHIVKFRLRKGRLTESWVIFMFVMISIPAIGCITYYYTNPFRHLALIILFVFCNSNFNRRLNKKNYGTSL